MIRYISIILIAALATPLWAGDSITRTTPFTSEELFGVTEDPRTPQEIAQKKEQDERESELRDAKYGVINKLHAGISSYCSLLGELIESASTEFTAQHHEGDSVDHDEIKELNELATMAHRQCDPFMIRIKGRVL